MQSYKKASNLPLNPLNTNTVRAEQLAGQPNAMTPLQ